MDDLTPKLLLVAGGLMQWLRALKGFPEWAYHVSAVGLGVSVFLLVHGFNLGAVRESLIGLLVWLPDHLPIIWGGTFIASGAAKAAIAGGANPGHVMVPVTNSK